MESAERGAGADAAAAERGAGADAAAAAAVGSSLGLCSRFTFLGWVETAVAVDLRFFSCFPSCFILLGLCWEGGQGGVQEVKIGVGVGGGKDNCPSKTGQADGTGIATTSYIFSLWFWYCFGEWVLQCQTRKKTTKRRSCFKLR